MFNTRNYKVTRILHKIISKINALIIAFKIKRVFYTIYFNFRYLPYNQAKKLPILFYKNAFATVINGGRIILSDEAVMSGKKIHIGQHTNDFEYLCENTHLNINAGTLRLNGQFGIRRGCIMEIRGNATFGDKVRFAPRCRVRIHNSILCGDGVAFSHETQVFDTNFHYMEPEDAPGFYPISKKIVINSYCWIANRCTIMPGVILPSYTVVASNSLVNKDFSSLKPNSVIGGVPAKLIKEKYARVWDTDRELEYHMKEFKWLRNNK